MASNYIAHRNALENFVYALRCLDDGQNAYCRDEDCADHADADHAAAPEGIRQEDIAPARRSLGVAIMAATAGLLSTEQMAAPKEDAHRE